MRAERRSRWLAWSGLMALGILHLDFWRPQRVELYFGWLPEEVLYRLIWVALAWAYLLWFSSRVWRSDGE